MVNTILPPTPRRVPLGLEEHSFPWGAGLEGTACFLPEPPEAQQAALGCWFYNVHCLL